MKKITISIIFFLVIISTIVMAQQPSEIFSVKDIEANINVNSAIINKNSGNIKDVTVNLMFFPKQDEYIEVKEFTTDPESSIVGKKIIYSWRKPKQKEIKYSYQTKVKTKQQKPKIYSRISYPLDNLPGSVKQYLKPSEIIDSETPSVKVKAKQLSEGKDDLYAVVTSTAKWVKDNVHYDLGTLTAQASQKAGWVLANRKGVCDEITSLFIALLRSQGIPAKFISGIAYTNSPEFPRNWGPHGWAEVYFPGKGWIPYDVTFGEYGWTDAGHIKMMESKDPQEPSTKYEWKGRGTELDLGELNIDAEAIKFGERIPSQIGLDVEVEKDKVKAGSYNLVKAKVENLHDHYVTAEVALAKVNELEKPSKERRTVILRPNQKKTIAWKIKVKEDLDNEYMYKIPVMVYTIRNETAKTSFAVSKNHPYYDAENIDKLAEGAEKEEIKKLDISCKANKNIINTGENINLKCQVKNIGEQTIKGESCFEKCQATELSAKEKKEFTKQYLFEKAGEYDLVFKINSDKRTRKSVTTINVIDKPKIKITEFTNTEVKSYKQDFKINIKMEKTSFATPKNLKLKVKIGKSDVDFDIGSLDKEQEFIIDANSASFMHQEEKIKLMMAYEDELGNKYTQEEERTIKIRETGFWDMIQMFFSRIF